MTKYPVFERWIVRLPPEERQPFLLGFSAQLHGRIQEINSLLDRDVDPPQEEVIDVADIPLPPGQPGNPIEIRAAISADGEPLADIEDLLKNSDEEDDVEVSSVMAPPFSFSELDTEGDSVLEDLDLSSAAVPMEVAEDALEDAMDNANNLSIDDTEDAPHHAEENVAGESMDNSTDALGEAAENTLEEAIGNALEEAIENVLEEAIEDALDEAENNAAKDSNELDEDPIAIGVVQEVSENVEALDEDPANEMVQEISENVEAVDEDPANEMVQGISENIESVEEVSAVDEAAQEIPDDPEALEEGPEEDPFLPEVGLEGESFAPLATSAMKSASAEAPIPSGASPPYQEKPKLTIWTAIFYPAPKIFVNLRFRGDAGYHLRHTPVEDRSEEYVKWRWPLPARIPTGIFYLILYIKF